MSAAAPFAGLSDPTSAVLDVAFWFDDEPPQAAAKAGKIKTIAKEYVFIRPGRVVGTSTSNTVREGNRCGEKPGREKRKMSKRRVTPLRSP